MDLRDPWISGQNTQQMDFLEQKQLDALIEVARPHARVKTLGHVAAKGEQVPVYGFVFGPDDPSLPVFGLFAGVHGLENIGTHVAIHFLRSFVHQLSWDQELKRRLQSCRLVAIPMINPGGMWMRTRCNPEGIDLMRNGPQDALEPTHFLVGGHRYSPRLPWYRGSKDGELALENQYLEKFVREEIFPSKAALSLDIHSGFGVQDRLWYPYAKTSAPFPNLAEAQNLGRLLDGSFQHHVYKMESQSDAYLINGDMWDFLYDQHRDQNGQGVFVPLALEMGSWLWIRKNPLQAFSLSGPFNPIKPHRYRRIMRRHLFLIDFLFRAAANGDQWIRAKKLL